MCCSTCHVIFEPATFAELGPVSDDEQDIIDRAAGVTDTSRLGCQVRVTKALEGARVSNTTAAMGTQQDSKDMQRSSRTGTA